jgi:hypothetical protein
VDRYQEEFYKTLLSKIESVSDKEYQRKDWIPSEGRVSPKFDETAMYILEIGDSVLDEDQDYGLNDIQRYSLERFRNELLEFGLSIGRYHYVRDFIDTPEWTRVTEMAKDVLIVLNMKAPLQESYTQRT